MAETTVAADRIVAHFAAWGETDSAARAATIAATVGESFFYADPNTPDPITSADDYNAYLAGFAEHMPGGSAVVAAVQVHHGHARATVDFTMGGKTMMRGQYFAELDPETKITRLIGFTGLGDEA